MDLTGPNHSARGHAALPPSSADKWLFCWGWMRTVAQHIELYGRPTSSAAADEGTRAHERLEELVKDLPGFTNLPDPHILELGEHEADEDLEPIYEWIREQPGEKYSETRVDFGKAYGFEGLSGTVDLIFVEPTRLTLPDLKFGRGIVEVTRNPQLMVYLAGVIARFGPREEYRLVILQPRAWHVDGPIREYTVSHDEFKVFEFDLVEAIEANFGEGSCDPGSHCKKYCPALGSCKTAKRHALRRFEEPDE